MNRREFLKGGAIATMFGWLGLGGMVKAEEPEPETPGYVAEIWPEANDWRIGPRVHVQFTEDEVAWRIRMPAVSEELLIDAEMGRAPFVRLDQQP